MTDDTLPRFRYYPDPVATDMLKAEEVLCACCGLLRPYVYVGTVSGRTDRLDGKLCPWCISDGSAAERFGASFNNCWSLPRAGISADVIQEIEKRTPGYVCWQTEDWLVHCDDVCEFHGDATVDEVINASEEVKADWRAHHDLEVDDWDAITAHYRPAGAVAFYKFVCRHCGTIRLGWDCM